MIIGLAAPLPIADAVSRAAAWWNLSEASHGIRHILSTDVERFRAFAGVKVLSP